MGVDLMFWKPMTRAALAATVAALLLGLAACGGGSAPPAKEASAAPAAPAPQPAPAPSGPKTVTVAFDSDVPTLDPIMHNERTAIIVNWHMFDALVQRQPDMKIGPNLATSWKNTSDTTWEFQLRQGVKFHNGEPFNADAVVWTIEKVLNPDTKSPQRGNFSAIKKVEKLGDYAVRITTDGPYPVLLERLQGLFIMPPKYFQEVGADKFAAQAVGTGPFKLVEWKKGDRVILEANKDYFKGAPAIDRLVFRNIPNKATQIQEVKAGGVDIIRQVPPDQVEELKAVKTLRISTAGILRTWYVGFDSRIAPWNNPKVREAVAYALNVDGYLKEILKGQGVRVPAMVHPNQFGFDPAIKGRPYDVNKAKQLLREAGYPNGFKTQFHHYVAGAGEQVGEAMAADLGQIGIQVEIKFYPDTGAFVQLNRAGKLPFFMGTWGSFSVFDADAILQPFLHSKGTYGMYFNRPDLDKAIDDARKSLDPQVRAPLYSKVQQVLYNEVPYISLFSANDIQAVNTRLQGYEARGDEIVYLYGVSVK